MKKIIIIFTSILMLFVLSSSQLLAKTKVFADSSLSTTQIIDSLSSLAAQNIEKQEYDITLDYLQQALDLSENAPDKYQYLRILVSFGRTYLLKNNYPLSQQYLFQFLKEHNPDLNKELIGDAYSIIANNYNSLGNVNAAHEYRLKAIEIDEVLGDTESLASNYYNLGSLFFYQDVFEKALEYYTKANELGYQIKSPKVIYNSTAALGSVYGQLKQINRALELNYKSLHIADSLDYVVGQAYSLGNIGSNYLDLGEYPKAKMYIERSLVLKVKLDDKWGQIGAHIALSELYSETNNFRLAEENIFTALSLAQSLDAKKRISDVYKLIADLYLSANKNDSAIEYLNKHIAVKDSVMNENILREMSNRKSEAAIQKKEYEINLLKKDNEILEKNKEVQRSRLIGFGLISIFFLIVSIVFRSLLSRQKGFTRLLETKNLEIEKQKNKIQIQNKKLESSNEDLKQFAYVASHDLREPLRMISSYGKILTRRYKDTLDESGQEFLYFMTDAASRMDHLLLDLLSYAKTSSNAQPFEKVSTVELLASVERVTESSFLEKGATLEIKKENLPSINGRKTQLNQLFQNLVTNGLKYNLNEKPHITIDCQTLEDKYIFSIKDNGIGIPEEHQAKIFEMFQRLHAKGEFEGTGIGLATCKKIADIHQGHITVESEEGLGSTFYFHLPK